VLEEAGELDVRVGLLGDEGAVDHGEAEAGQPADDLAAGVAVERDPEVLAQAAQRRVADSCDDLGSVSGLASAAARP
jgi:hypothetical protein